jgi:gliding motility-associated-like protein
MKCFFLSCFVLLICSGKTLAQPENNIWAFGYGAGLDFNSGVPVAINTNMNAREGTASISDASGQLLFYTEGFTVWDRNGNPMPNGTDLTPFATVILPSPTGSTTQGSLIIPLPGNDSLYYIFSMTCLEAGPSALRLYYSIVNINANGGLGDIVAGQKSIFVDSMLSERMTAVVGDWCSIWLLTSAASGPVIKAFEITKNGLNNTPVISTPMPGTALAGDLGVLKVSPDGHRLAATQLGFINGTTLFDFNNGIVSNPVNIQPQGGSYGAEFSPDNSKLYINSSSIAQFNLSSNNTDTIIASRINITTSGISHMKLAPDGKIYFVGSANALSRIPFPDAAGIACGLQANAIPILGSAGLGLPNEVPVMPVDTIRTSQVIKAGCFAAEHMLQALNMTNTWGYIWNNGATTPMFEADTPGTYWISYRKSPCTVYIDTFKLQFPYGTLPQVQASANCTGSNNGKATVIQNPSDTNAYTFLWTNAAGDTLSMSDTLVAVPGGLYTVHIATFFCDTTLQVQVPDVDFRVAFNSSDILCEDTDMQILNTSDNHFTSFTWDFGNGITTNQVNPVARYPDPGLYEITLTGTGRVCQDTLKKQIVIDPQYQGNFLMDRDSICTGQAITFTVTGDSTAERLYWSFGDGTNFSTPYENRSSYAFDLAGRWWITLSATYRTCETTLWTDSVHVFALPNVDLGPDTALCLHDRPFNLSNRAPAPEEPCIYSWSTGSTAATLEIMHPGTYTLNVSTEPLGCSNAASIEVHKDCHLDIPNVFTPNNDGLNDYFFPRQLLSRSVKEFEMFVYNRWGQVIFHTRENKGRGWDGRFNNAVQPEGVYIYTITAIIDEGKQEQYEGNVTLLR